MVIDSSAGFGEALNHLSALGHRDFAFIGGPRDIPSAEMVRRQVETALDSCRLRLSCSLECNYKIDGGWSAVRTLVAQKRLVSAILCGNDLIALGAIRALEQMGVDVPSQVSVVGHVDLLIARLARPPLTTIHVSSDQIGRLAFQRLASLAAAPGSHGGKVAVETRLVIRKSTAPARQA